MNYLLSTRSFQLLAAVSLALIILPDSRTNSARTKKLLLPP